MVLRSQSVGEQDAADQQGAFSRRGAPGLRPGPLARLMGTAGTYNFLRTLTAE